MSSTHFPTGILLAVTVCLFLNSPSLVSSSSSSSTSTTSNQEWLLQENIDTLWRKSPISNLDSPESVTSNNYHQLDELSLLVSRDPPECNDGHSSRYDPLACWLWKLRIKVPDQQVSKLGITAYVSDLVCTGFTVEAIDSVYTPSEKQSSTETTKTPSIHLTVKGISAACSGSYKVSPVGMSGGITAQATSHDDANNNDNALDLTWNFISSFKFPNETTTHSQQQQQQQQHHVDNDTTDNDKYWMPTAFQTTQCRSYLHLSDLHFSGSISSKFINWFTGMIQDSVTSQLNDMLCPTLQQSVDPLMTHGMVAADQLLGKYLAPTTDNKTLTGATVVGNDHYPSGAEIPVRQHTLQHQQDVTPSLVETNATLVDFERDAPLLMKSLRAVNHLLDCYYNIVNGGNNDCHGIINNAMKGLVSVLLDNLADEIPIPLPAIAHNIQFQLFNLGKISLDVQDLKVVGLDQVDRLTILSPLWGANLSSTNDKNLSIFQTLVQTNTGLNFTANINLTILPSPGGIIKGESLSEFFTIQFNTTNLKGLGNVGVAMDRDRFQQLQVGTVLDSLPIAIFHQHAKNASDERKCFLEAINSLLVSDLQLHTLLASVALNPKLENKTLKRRQSTLLTERVEEDLDTLINRMMQLILAEYQPLLVDAVTGLVERPLLTKINQLIEALLQDQSLPMFAYNDVFNFASSNLASTRSLSEFEEEKHCSSGDEVIDKDHHDLLNFSTLGFLEQLNEFINKPSSVEGINHAINQWASEVGKRHSHPSAGPKSSWAALLSGTKTPGVSFRLQHLQIDNLGTVEHIDLLSPEMDGMHLRNGFSVGITNSLKKSEIRKPRIHASIEMLYHPRNISATINATAAVGDIFLDGGSILHLDVTRLRQLTLTQLFSQGHCVIVPFQKHEIYNNQNVSRIGAFLGNTSVSVTGASSFENFTVFTDTIENPAIASLITDVIAWTLNTLRSSLNSGTRSSLDQAEGYCTGGQIFGYDDDPPVLNDGFKDEWLLPVVGIFLGSFLLFNTIFLIFVRCSSRDSAVEGTMSGETLQELTEPMLPYNTEERGSVHEDDAKPAGTETSQNGSLVQNTALSAFTRHAVPIFIIGTIVLLSSGNGGSGATVDLYISLNELTITLPSLFAFGLINTAKDMWHAHIYPLFFLVLIMSGVWPYMKLFLMLGSWTTPTHMLSSKTRERLLLALDALGKFALVDTYLFVLMMVAFRYHVDISEDIALDVFVSPETGFYAFLMATCFSLLVGHYMVYCHRACEMWHLMPRRRGAVFDIPREFVLGHRFIVRNPGSGEEERLHLSRRFRVFLLLGTLVAAVLLAVGITQKSFKFEIGGIAGDVLGEDRVEHYSLLSLGSSLRNSARDPSAHGIIFLEVTYYFYAVATPFACLGMLILLLVCPMTLPTQRIVLTLAEIANAWSAVEVFVISVIASLLEISTFSSFIIGDKCELIDKILKEYFMSALDDASDATCFTVRSTVEASSGVLVAGVLVNSFSVSILLRFIHCSIAERIEEEMESTLLERRSFDDDVLRNDTRRTSIAGLLSWCGCSRRLVFDNPQGRGNAVTNSSPATQRYLPQSADTYSVTPDVNWDDTMTHSHDEQTASTS